jgi:hypothetical protein
LHKVSHNHPFLDSRIFLATEPAHILQKARHHLCHARRRIAKRSLDGGIYGVKVWHRRPVGIAAVAIPNLVASTVNMRVRLDFRLSVDTWWLRFGDAWLHKQTVLIRWWCYEEVFDRE